jgi:hypothetical protein
MKIQNEYMELTTRGDSKYKLSVKNADKKVQKIILEYLENNIRNWNHNENLPNHIEQTKHSFTFNATNVQSLKNVSQQKNINAITVKAVMFAAMHLIHTLEKYNFTIIDFSLDDFIFIEMGGEINSKDYTVFCLFIGFDKLIKVNNDFIEIVVPMQKNKFFAPEIENISSLPAKISYPNKSSYYSIGKIALYLLSKNAKSRTMDEYKTDLAPLLNTKIYWMILRCLAYNPTNRYLLYI